jgi:hypothetical protein
VTIPFKPIVKLISSNAHGAELILPPENERYFAKVINFVVELQTSKIDKGILISIKLLSPGIYSNSTCNTCYRKVRIYITC